MKFRFLSGLRAIRSSGKLEISEFLPIPLSVSLLPEEFLRKAGVWLRACLTAHSFKAEPLFFIICLLPFSIRCSFFFQGWRNGERWKNGGQEYWSIWILSESSYRDYFSYNFLGGKKFPIITKGDLFVIFFTIRKISEKFLIRVST